MLVGETEEGADLLREEAKAEAAVKDAELATKNAEPPQPCSSPHMRISTPSGAISTIASQAVLQRRPRATCGSKVDSRLCY